MDDEVRLASDCLCLSPMIGIAWYQWGDGTSGKCFAAALVFNSVSYDCGSLLLG
jgi:hypothetical protein